MSLALYALVALRRGSVPATEAAMKYFVLGALASGMLLYGMSMIYGATGTLDIAKIAASLAGGSANMTLALFGLVFIVAGLAFKLGAVPFHMWVPDVYQGAPTAVTLLIGGAPKLAAFVFVVRILSQGLEPLVSQWQGMLVILAVLSMAIGNITAIAQTNLKRMLAYSTISHMGFLVLGILAGTPAGLSASLFYAVVYVLMSLAGFGVLLLLSRAGVDCETLDDLKGLNRKNSWYAFLMLVVMFSMAGIPPMVGFNAKLAVLKSVVDIGLIWLAVVGVVFSLIGAFYYLRVVKVMYFDEATDAEPVSQVGMDMRVLLSVNAIALLVLGIVPDGLYSVCVEAMKQSLQVL
jgi:NADH-quinone oxidoreductase subunit N